MKMNDGAKATMRHGKGGTNASLVYTGMGVYGGYKYKEKEQRRRRGGTTVLVLVYLLKSEGELDESGAREGGNDWRELVCAMRAWAGGQAAIAICRVLMSAGAAIRGREMGGGQCAIVMVAGPDISWEIFGECVMVMQDGRTPVVSVMV